MAHDSRIEPLMERMVRFLQRNGDSRIEAIAGDLGCSEKDARSAIDRARAKSYRIDRVSPLTFGLRSSPGRMRAPAAPAPNAPPHARSNGVISAAKWERLVALNKAAVGAGLAEPGVFAPGIGPGYAAGTGLLYVGKSAGPLGGLVGSAYEQAACSRASTDWMITRRNKSAFWQFVEQIDATRRGIAWTNVCKMDERGGERPPSGVLWRDIAAACADALADEFSVLSPRVAVFATSGLYSDVVSPFLGQLACIRQTLPFDDGWTSLYATRKGTHIVLTKHPQGWPRAERDRVIALVRELLGEVQGAR